MNRKIDLKLIGALGILSWNMLDHIHYEYVNCNLCGCDDTQLLYEVTPVRRNQEGKFKLVKCRRCGSIYLNPRPDSNSIAYFYPEDYEYHERRKISFLERIYYKHFRALGMRKGRILDVGCGNGNYLALLNKQGWDCFGTEVDDSIVRHITNELGLKVLKGQLYELDLPDEYFDVVTFWGSLEHTNNPFKNLQSSHQMLKSKGRIIIWVPNIVSLEARIFRGYWHHLEIPTHYYQFCPQTLTMMPNRAGFTIEKVRFDPIAMGIMPSVGYVFNKIGIKLNFNNLISKLLCLPLDALLSLMKSNGMITVYAVKK